MARPPYQPGASKLPARRQASAGSIWQHVAVPRDGVRERINAVCPYFTMFPLDFPLRVLGKAGKDARVLDPFCGRGTTLFAGRLLGMASVGIDSNPIAVAVARAKQVHADLYVTEAKAVELLTATHEPTEVPDGDFWNLCYHPSTLLDICTLREQLVMSSDTAAAIMLRAVILGVLHGPMNKGVPSYLSNQMPRTYATKPDAAVRFWRGRDMKPPRVRVLDVLLKRIRYLLQETPRAAIGRTICGDSRLEVARLPETFTHVVTSPPYYGMRTYAQDQWLRNWFLGGSAQVDYGQSQQINHTGRDQFVEQLRTVWRAAAERCDPGARLIVRFGSLPSVRVQPAELLRSSLTDSNWEVTAVRSAGAPTSRTRQATQFTSTGSYSPEVDLYARLRV
jgi:SAM-dependent methyltransferase